MAKNAKQPEAVEQIFSPIQKKMEELNERSGIIRKSIKWINLVSKRLERSCIAAFSGQTAFFLMLSFLPFLLFCFSLIQITPLTKEDLENFIFAFIPADFQSILHGFAMDIYDNSNAGVLSATVITAVYLSSKAFYALIQGFNSMFEAHENRNFLLLHIYSIIYSIFFALIIISTLMVFVFGNRILHYLGKFFPLLASTLLSIFEFRLLLGFLLLFLLFLLLYRFLPNCSYRLKELVPGAVFSTTGWLLFSYFYSIYINNFSNYASFYGAMTAIALLMVWLYTCMYMLLLGGIINQILHKWKMLKTRKKQND